MRLSSEEQRYLEGQDGASKLIAQKARQSCCKECMQVLEASEAAGVLCLCVQVWVLSGLILLCSFGRARAF